MGDHQQFNTASKMKIIVAVLFVALVVAQAYDDMEFVMLRHGLPPPPPRHSRAATPVWGTITQKLDNFDSSNTKTWSMRYIANSQHFKTGGPIFIMVGAEWTIDPGWLQGGQMYDIAAQNGAYMYYTEHRYYGNSKPTSDLSTDNLTYLTTPQALADVAHFITSMKANNPALTNSKVVIFGGSYGGNMAIWMREKYPDLVHAAVSSSAPVLAEVDFKEYFEVVQSSLADPECYGVIRNGVAAARELLKTAAGLNQLKNDFKLCANVNPRDFYDVAYFFNSIANEFAGIVQYASGSDLTDTCDELMNPSALDDYTKLVRFVSDRRNGCVGNYDNFVRYYAQINLSGDSRQWLFQTCNEYGYFQTSASANQPFGTNFPVQMNYKMCTDIYGAGFDGNRVNTAAANTNKNYGGLNPPVTRVISVHGTVDPWHALGLTRDVNKNAPVVIVPGTSHCGDLSSLSFSDSTAMRNAKLLEQNLVKTWLAQD